MDGRKQKKKNEYINYMPYVLKKKLCTYVYKQLEDIEKYIYLYIMYTNWM